MPDKHIDATDIDRFNEPMLCTYDAMVECPVCHRALDPRVLCGYFAENRDMRLVESGYSHTVYLLAFCPKCRNAFLAEYFANKSKAILCPAMLENAKFQRAYPTMPDNRPFSENISSLSPNFVVLFRQSETAEAAGLCEIAGCGYRKSLEFLVKDYLCHKLPEAADDIKKELLGNSIKRIDDVRIQILAERATWIGNDETHYVRKHCDLDINDMKRFISATLHYIDAELTFADALSVAPKK